MKDQWRQYQQDTGKDWYLFSIDAVNQKLQVRDTARQPVDDVYNTWNIYQAGWFLKWYIFSQNF